MPAFASESAALDVAATVIELARAAAGSAQVEVSVDRAQSALTRFANSYIHQNVADDATSVRLRVHVDGRTATGVTTVADVDGLRAVVERTLAAARLCPPDPSWPGLTGPTPLPGAADLDEATFMAEADLRAGLVGDFIDAAGGLETAGYCRSGGWVGAFANSAGQSVTGRAAEAAMDGIARRAGADGVARWASPRIADLDGAALGARAAAKALAGGDPVELPPGRYEVVLEPLAVSDLLQNLAFFGFNGKALAEGRSFVRLGEAQFDPAITLVDDVFGEQANGRPFDAEGTPKRRLELIAAGVTAAVAHDRRTAAAADATPTGHAIPSGAWGPIPTNLCLLPSGALGDARGRGADLAAAAGAAPQVDPAAAALVSGVERGLLVSDLWYTRVLDPKTLVVTGLTRNGVWLIEGGKVTAPVRNFRFTQSYPDALGSGNVLDVGTLAASTPGGWDGGSWRQPALRLASWNFTGGASG
ncbi:TldD/PmbA family protein [Pilimelia columellifera]|uniref:TldD/PmbA family protein n=1 Tax=Pilimelia columellifera subsp. columellifera TaxID=706583 RepID=A0ABN3N753_9ACTN